MDQGKCVFMQGVFPEKEAGLDSSPRQPSISILTEQIDHR